MKSKATPPEMHAFRQVLCFPSHDRILFMGLVLIRLDAIAGLKVSKHQAQDYRPSISQAHVEWYKDPAAPALIALILANHL